MHCVKCNHKLASNKCWMADCVEWAEENTWKLLHSHWHIRGLVPGVVSGTTPTICWICSLALTVKVTETAQVHSIQDYRNAWSMCNVWMVIHSCCNYWLRSMEPKKKKWKKNERIMYSLNRHRPAQMNRFICVAQRHSKMWRHLMTFESIALNSRWGLPHSSSIAFESSEWYAIWSNRKHPNPEPMPLQSPVYCWLSFDILLAVVCATEFRIHASERCWLIFCKQKWCISRYAPPQWESTVEASRQINLNNTEKNHRHSSTRFVRI